MFVRLFAVLALALACKGESIPITSYFNDPFTEEPLIKQLDSSKFGQLRDGRPTLRSSSVWITDESIIYRKNSNTQEFEKFAWNPWPQTWLNPHGSLTFPDEARFPIFQPERGPDNKIVMKDGLQVWTPQDLNIGNTTVFDAANSVKDAAEQWGGRYIDWGVEGQLLIETHVFIDFNAFYSPSARQLFFGVVPYRLPGHTEVNMWETATSWEIAAHEAGHAVEWAIKPNIGFAEISAFDPWGESFGDQLAMWTSLRNPDRVSRLLAETKGNLNQSNSLSRLVEVFAALVGTGRGMREAFQDKKVSDTSDEEHDRSEVITGAAYRIFLAVYEDLKGKCQGESDALKEAGRVMGVFTLRSMDFLPENYITLEDIGKAYLKVDKEIFGGRYRDVLANEFRRREIFDANSFGDWLAHEDALPKLWLPDWWTDPLVADFIEANQDRLGVGADFGLRLQSVTRLNGEALGHMIVRVQLTQGRGAKATPLKNHGILVFRANGDLADYHSPLPEGSAPAVSKAVLHAQALSRIGRARQARLQQYGVPLSLVPKADGSLAVEAHVVRGEGLNSYLQVYTPENPRGERREISHSPFSPAQRKAIADRLAQ